MKPEAAGSRSSAPSELAPRTLWADRVRGRYFVVPDEPPLRDMPAVAVPSADAPAAPAAAPDGASAEAPETIVELRTITGRQIRVREEDVRPYEVTREAAVAWLQSQLDPAIETLKRAAMLGTERLQQAADRLRAQNAAAFGRAGQAAPGADAAERVRAAAIEVVGRIKEEWSRRWTATSPRGAAAGAGERQHDRPGTAEAAADEPRGSKCGDGERADGERADGERADGERADGERADGERADGVRGGGDHADTAADRERRE